MAVNLSPVGGVAAQFFTNNGVPLAGGKIYTYLAGTTTPAATYTSATGSTAWTNPIVLNSGGRVPSGGEIWLTDGIQYKFVLKDANDVTIATYDNILGINSNFVNFTNEQEIQTATSGQTVFTLTTMQYQVGTNSLSVFVDGVNQYGPGALYAYTETDSTTVTFTTGLHVGAEVKFTTSAINASSYGDASQISYDPPFTGSVATNVEAKLAQTISVDDFGAVGDGITDDTTALTNFFNSAISRPGVEHRLFAKTYAISAVMPTINVSGVWITGEGVMLHEMGSLFTGPVIKWIGSSNPGAMIRIEPTIIGPSSQRVGHVVFSGIGLDCNNGAIDYGMVLRSAWLCDIDVAIANAGFTGLATGVVSTAFLPGQKTTQRNRIRLQSRQIEAPTAFCFTAGGDATDNVSMN
jgi:hypothetical protein